MTVEEIRKVHSAQPFLPFVLRLADGNQYSVNHPEFLAFSQTGRTVYVATPDGTHEIIDVRLITSARVDEEGRRQAG